MMPFSREERQFVYTWLSNMLGHELSASQLAQYQQGLFDDFFAFLTEQGFQAQVEGIQQQLQQLKTVELAHLELAADYTQLFLLDGSSSTLPYASAYLRGTAGLPFYLFGGIARAFSVTTESG